MSPQCSEHQITASNRPANLYFWHALLLVDEIKAMASDNGEQEQNEPKPSKATVETASDLIAETPFWLLGNPDVSPFCSEVHLSWTAGPKQIVLMFFPNRTPLVHHYYRAPGAISEHGIERASADRLAYWLRWLRA
jgi:hypothetical protein